MSCKTATVLVLQCYQDSHTVCADLNSNQTVQQLISQIGTLLIRKLISEISLFSVDEFNPRMHIGMCLEAHVVLSCLF